MICDGPGLDIIFACSYKHHSFTLGNGLKPGDDFETVRQVMGEPDSFDEGDTYDSAFYYYYDGRGEVRFYFHKDDPSLSSIELTLCVKQ